jgi:hypothetical protein
MLVGLPSPKSPCLAISAKVTSPSHTPSSKQATHFSPRRSSATWPSAASSSGIAAPTPAQHLRRGLQPRPPTPLTAPSGHPGNRLHRPPQSRPRKPHRHPQPGPPRPHRPSRRDHPARRRTPTPHRRRPNLHRHPRTRADPRSPDPHHPRRHRPTPARANTEPHQGLPTHRRTKRPPTEKVPNLTQVRNYSDVLRHHNVPPAGFEPATSGL